MGRERWNNGGNYFDVDQAIGSSSSSSSAKLLLPISSSSPSSCSPGGGGSAGAGVAVEGRSYIEHPVSRLDTLAGVAIKYGVEVADIKKINGLVTDLQMFALKSLHIPLPGRHPPSPCLANGFDAQGQSSSEQTPLDRRHSDLFDSFQSLKLKSSPPQVSPAMSSLQGYYGLKPADRKTAAEGCEMAVYRRESAHCLEDGPFVKTMPHSNPPPSHPRKCKSVANGLSENGDLPYDVSVAEAREGKSEKCFEKLVRRRQKSETDFSARTPEMLLKEDNSSGGFSAIASKGLALRPKAASRNVSAADNEAGWPSPIPIGLGDSFVADSLNVVRKSSSTSNLQDSDGSTSSSLWSTSKWSLKPDLQALSTAAITRPIFDGLPKPITGRKNKAALD